MPTDNFISAEEIHEVIRGAERQTMRTTSGDPESIIDHLAREIVELRKSEIRLASFIEEGRGLMTEAARILEHPIAAEADDMAAVVGKRITRHYAPRP